MLVKKQGNVLSKTVEVLGAFDSMRATEVRITLKMNKVQGIYTVARCTHTKEGKNRMRKRLHQSPTHLKKKLQMLKLCLSTTQEYTHFMFTVNFPEYLIPHWNYGGLYFSQIKMKGEE